MLVPSMNGLGLLNFPHFAFFLVVCESRYILSYPCHILIQTTFPMIPTIL